MDAVGSDDRLSPLINSRKQLIFRRRWLPPNGQSPRGLVLILHGFGEHSGLYEDEGQDLAKEGLAVYAQDLVGFGQSEGDRAHIDLFSHHLDDVMQHLSVIREEHPRLPLFFLGYSLGGLIATSCALRLGDELRGLVLLSPLMKFGQQLSLSALMMQMLRVTSWVSPQYEFSTAPDPAVICSDEKVIKKQQEDPLVYQGGPKANFYLEVCRHQSEVMSHLHDVTCASLIIQSEHDEWCDVAGSTQLHVESNNPDKSLQFFEGTAHRVHSGPRYRERCMKSIKSWIVARTQDNEDDKR